MKEPLLREAIRKFYNKEGDGYITYQEFKDYYMKIIAMH